MGYREDRGPKSNHTYGTARSPFDADTFITGYHGLALRAVVGRVSVGLRRRRQDRRQGRSHRARVRGLDRCVFRCRRPRRRRRRTAQRPYRATDTRDRFRRSSFLIWCHNGHSAKRSPRRPLSEGGSSTRFPAIQSTPAPSAGGWILTARLAPPQLTIRPRASQRCRLPLIGMKSTVVEWIHAPPCICPTLVG
jgi:hypothetical protein